MTVSARDEDTGSNGEITYSIVGGDLAVFELDSEFGHNTLTLSVCMV